MNQLCKVCGEPAAGFHFGAFTCEGCKVSLLLRQYNSPNRYFIELNPDDCEKLRGLHFAHTVVKMCKK